MTTDKAEKRSIVQFRPTSSLDVWNGYVKEQIRGLSAARLTSTATTYVSDVIKVADALLIAYQERAVPQELELEKVGDLEPASVREGTGARVSSGAATDTITVCEPDRPYFNQLKIGDWMHSQHSRSSAQITRIDFFCGTITTELEWASHGIRDGDVIYVVPRWKAK